MIIKNKIIGSNIYLRSLEISDIKKEYVNWLKDEDVIQYLEIRHTIQTLSRIKTFINECNESNNTYVFGIFTDDNMHIGNIKLGPINIIHNISSISILVGNKHYWGKGIASEAIDILTKFAFKKVGLNKLTAGMYIENISSMRAFEKVGFTKEGLRKKHYNLNDKYVDVIELGLLSEQYNQ